MKRTAFQDVVISHCMRYPMLQAEDLYKLTHQAALGSEHAVKDMDGARAWLLREINQQPASSQEPQTEVISPGTGIAWVHLGPYIEAGGEPETLLQAFVRTANEYRGSSFLLKEYLKNIEDLAENTEIKFKQEDLSTTISRMEAAGFPAVHDSVQAWLHIIPDTGWSQFSSYPQIPKPSTRHQSDDPTSSGMDYEINPDVNFSTNPDLLH